MPNPDSRLTRAGIAALVLSTLCALAVSIAAQQPSVRLNRTIDKLALGHTLGSVGLEAQMDAALKAARTVQPR